MHSLQHALDTMIVGQKRTSKYKQFVFLDSEHAYKGPYSAEKVDKILARSQRLLELGAQHILHPSGKVTLSEGLFLLFPSLLTGEPELWDYEWHEESFSSYRYRVLRRQQVYKLGDALANNAWVLDSPVSLLRDLVLLYVLRVGDTGLYNILVNPVTRQIFVIDYDEDSPQMREGSTFYFSKPPGQKHRWEERVITHYKATAASLSPLLEEPLSFYERERLTKALELLHQYGGTPNASPDLGQMRWNGLMGGSTTHHGYKLDAVKSGLQKYIRRGMAHKALYCAFELYRFSHIPGAVGAITNLYNRLAVIAAEDVGPADLPLCVAVVREVNLARREPERLAAVVQMLAEAEKTRLMSHLWCAFCTEEGRRLNTHILPLPSSPQEETPDWFLPGDSVKVVPYVLAFRQSLAYETVEERYQAFSVWHALIVNCPDEKVVLRYKTSLSADGRTRKPDILLWQSLYLYLPREAVDILCMAYYEQREPRPFLAAAITAAIYRTPYDSLDLNTYAKQWQQHPTLKILIEGSYQLTLDPFVIDMHTREGRQRGANTATFAREGALVERQSPLYYHHALHALYDRVKGAS